jgi:hypothetical protein
MASRRRKIEGSEQAPETSMPAEDEADILEEMGAEPDESGALVVSEESIREVGAVDSESVRENRRLRAIATKRRAGEKNVQINTGDVLATYDTVLKSWPANTIDIHVRRLSGAPVQRVIISRPRYGAELYEALRLLHGTYEEADYEVKLKDNTTHQFRGHGRITMPDTRAVSQQGQPMQQPAASVVPQTSDPVHMMGEMFGLFQRMQTSAQPPPQPQQPPPLAMPPPPSPQSSPAEMMAWMQRAFELFLQTQAARSSAPPQAQPAPAPAPAQQPPPSPPPQPSAFEQMREMFELFKMFQQTQTQPDRRPRPPYYPQTDGQDYRPQPQQPPQPPPRQLTVSEQMRESMGFVRTVVDAVREIDTLMPGQGQQAASGVAEDDDDDNPIRIMETGAGKIKLALNKEDGSLRWAETGMMALPGFLKWLGEQREAIQKASNERQIQQHQPVQQQLPLGYVEVGPGYKPPPGYVAIPVDQTGAPLPPPPAYMPPPIQTEPAPAPQPDRRTWGAPTIPDPNSVQ